MKINILAAGFLAMALLSITGCCTRPGQLEARKGDEIIVAGQFFHTGTKVVTWMDPGGYDAYRVDRRFVDFTNSDWDHTIKENPHFGSPNRYNLRVGLTPAEIERVRGGGWDLPTLQKYVDQFVLHYDDAGISRVCFNTLQDHRDLSVHFMLDLDGTIYQTLDLKERAWHATISNSRSVGVEIANIGAYPPNKKNPLSEWYQPTTNGPTLITIPARVGPNPERTPNFVGHPARPEPIIGVIQGEQLEQYDYTPQQYQALIHLTAALCRIFPKIKCDFPHDASGQVINHKLPKADWEKYEGVLGHYHIQTDKTDPGPAFQWDYVIDNARKLMGTYSIPTSN